MSNNNNIQMAFAAIDKVIEQSIPSFKESENRGKDYIQWGEDNIFPNYLYGLYTDVTTLRSIVNRTADMVAGDGVNCVIEQFNKEVNKKGDTLYELIQSISRDYLVYGNAFIQVVRNKAGQIGELYHLPAKYMRTSKKNDLFYYSEEYDKKYSRSNKRVVYPKFVPEATDIATSVIMLKSENDKTYGLPIYIASLKDCEVERQLSDFNLSQLENGFFGSYVFNFGNGIPTDEQKAEIEKDIQEKFCGSGNVGRFLLNFSDGKDNGVTLSKLDIVNYAEKYNTTSERASKKIYEAFGASPVLMGVEKDTSGFNDEDYQQAFKIYNRLTVRPLQKRIVTMFDKIFNTTGSVEIKPFTIDWSDDEETNDTVNNDEQTI